MVGLNVLRCHRQVDRRHAHRLRNLLASDFQASNIQAAIESQVVSRTLRPNVGRHLSRDLGVRIEGDAERRRQAGRFLDRRIGRAHIHVHEVGMRPRFNHSIQPDRSRA